MVAIAPWLWQRSKDVNSQHALESARRPDSRNQARPSDSLSHVSTPPHPPAGGASSSPNLHRTSKPGSIPQCKATPRSLHASGAGWQSLMTDQIPVGRISAPRPPEAPRVARLAEWLLPESHRTILGAPSSTEDPHKLHTPRIRSGCAAIHRQGAGGRRFPVGVCQPTLSL